MKWNWSVISWLWMVLRVGTSKMQNMLSEFTMKGHLPFSVVSSRNTNLLPFQNLCLYLAYCKWIMQLWSVTSCVTQSPISIGGLYCPPLIPAGIQAIPRIPEESNLAEGPAKLMKWFQQNFEWQSNSTRMVPGITWKECCRWYGWKHFTCRKSDFCDFN